MTMNLDVDSTAPEGLGELPRTKTDELAEVQELMRPDGENKRRDRQRSDALSSADLVDFAQRSGSKRFDESALARLARETAEEQGQRSPKPVPRPVPRAARTEEPVPVDQDTPAVPSSEQAVEALSEAPEAVAEAPEAPQPVEQVQKDIEQHLEQLSPHLANEQRILAEMTQDAQARWQRLQTLEAIDPVQAAQERSLIAQELYEIEQRGSRYQEAHNSGVAATQELSKIAAFGRRDVSQQELDDSAAWVKSEFGLTDQDLLAATMDPRWAKVLGTAWRNHQGTPSRPMVQSSGQSNRLGSLEMSLRKLEREAGVR